MQIVHVITDIIDTFRFQIFYFFINKLIPATEYNCYIT